MLYLISEIVFSLALAAAIGLGIGWWLRAVRAKNRGGETKELQAARREVGELEAKLREAGPQAMVLEPRIAELEKDKSQLEGELKRLRQQAKADQAALQELDRAQRETDGNTEGGVDDELRRVQQDLGDAEDAAAKLREEITQLREAVAAADQRCAEAEERVRTLSAEAESLRAEGGDADELRAQVADAESARAASVSAAEAMEARLADVEERERARERETSDLRDEIARALQRQEELLATATEAERQRASYQDLEKKYQELLATVAEAERQGASYRELEKKYEELAAASSVAQSEQSSYAELEAKYDELVSVHSDCDFAFEALRQQIVDLREKVAAASRTDNAAQPAAATNGTTRHSGVGRRPGSLLSQPTRLPDDLKQINGIGPRVERILNQLGVYYFEQLASLEPDEVSWLDAQLADYRGRIMRDEWVDQAKRVVSGQPHVKEY